MLRARGVHILDTLERNGFADGCIPDVGDVNQFAGHSSQTLGYEAVDDFGTCAAAQSVRQRFDVAVGAVGVPVSEGDASCA